MIRVLNKFDLLETVPEPKPDEVFVSAKTGYGIDNLLNRIGRELEHEWPNADQAIPVSQDQVDRLRRVLELIETRDLEAAVAQLFD